MIAGKGVSFKCEHCSRKLISDSTLDEMYEERNLLFPELIEDDVVQVCDDCFKEIMRGR